MRAGVSFGGPSTAAGANGLEAAVRAVDLRAVQCAAGARERRAPAALPASMLRLELFRSGDTIFTFLHSLWCLNRITIDIHSRPYVPVHFGERLLQVQPASAI